MDRARVASLERAIASGSGPESCISWLERAFFARAVWLFFARARSLSLERASGCRPEGLSCWLERASFRSSALLSFRLERELLGSSESFLCLVARATKASLERECFISAVSSDFKHHFFTPLFDQTLDPRPSLSTLTFSLRIDLPRV